MSKLFNWNIIKRKIRRLWDSPEPAYLVNRMFIQECQRRRRAKRKSIKETPRKEIWFSEN